MKRIKMLAGVAIACWLGSCSNSQLESRITKLEGRVAAMEGGNGAVSSASSAPAISSGSPQAATSATPAEPEEKPEGPLPLISFSEELHDFGTIKEGDVVEHVFKFTNDGEAPLIITDAKASCGCTVPEWPKEPIPMGQEGEIKVRFNSKGKPGVQNKTVTLTSNTWPATQRVKIRANVLKEGE